MDDRDHGRSILEAALACMTDAMFISDAKGRFVECNDAFATFHRFRNKGEYAKIFAEYPDILDVFMANGDLVPLNQWAVPRALRGEIAANAEYTLRRKDTGETWVGSYNFCPIRNKEGVIIGSAVTARDITPYKQAEESQRKALTKAEAGERILTTLMENIPEGITIADAPGVKIRMVSRYGQEILGGAHDRMTAEEVADQWKVFKKDGKTPVETADLPLSRAILKGETILNEEIVQVNARGQALSLLCNAAPIRDNSGIITGGIVAWRDITERKRLVEELETKSVSLQELNAAFRVLLKQREDDKQAMEEKFVMNVRNLVLPCVEQMKKGRLDSAQRVYLEALETHLTGITTPLLQNIRQFNLTPKEIKVAVLVWQGRSTKQIAEMLGIAPGSVDVHRRNIRKKLGLTNKKENLLSRLESFET